MARADPAKEPCYNNRLALAERQSWETRRRQYAACANKALSFRAIGTIYGDIPPARKGRPMSTDKTANKHAGAPAAKKLPEGERFDLFRTFRHPPKPAEPIRAVKAEVKPKA
jgi:hypothetical protein